MNTAIQEIFEPIDQRLNLISTCQLHGFNQHRFNIKGAIDIRSKLTIGFKFELLIKYLGYLLKRTEKLYVSIDVICQYISTDEIEKLAPEFISFQKIDEFENAVTIENEYLPFEYFTKLDEYYNHLEEYRSRKQHDLKIELCDINDFLTTLIKEFQEKVLVLNDSSFSSLPLNSESEINFYKNAEIILRKQLHPFRCININGIELMKNNEFDVMIAELMFLIENKTIPKNIIPLNKIELEGQFIRFTFGLAFQNIFNTRGIANIWIDYIYLKFKQFNSQDKSVFKKKISVRPPHYEENIKKMISFSK